MTDLGKRRPFGFKPTPPSETSGSGFEPQEGQLQGLQGGNLQAIQTIPAGRSAAVPVEGVGIYTASAIAAALGKKRPNVSRALSAVSPDGVVLVNGQKASAWAPRSLPADMQEALAAEAKKRGYASDEHLLKHPPGRWEPPIPMNEIAPAVIVKAQRLQNVLCPILSSLEAGERERAAAIDAGLKSFLQAFGRAISKRHFERLLDRCIERDQGAQDWGRLELYLPERCSPKRNPSAPVGIDTRWAYALEIAARIKPGVKIDQEAQALFWDAVCAAYSNAIDNGGSAKAMRRELRQVIESKVHFVDSRGRALERMIRRRLDRWSNGGAAAAALIDLRTKNSGRKAVPLPEPFRNFIAIRSARRGGRIAQAWRESIAEGVMPPEVAAAYPFDWEHKSYVPKNVLRALQGDVKLLGHHLKGPQCERDKGSHNTRDYSGAASGRIFSSDDMTGNIFFYIEGADGRPECDVNGKPILTRGQFMPWICARSSYIVNFRLIPEKGYDSIEILRGIADLHDQWGLPEELLFENGIWRAKIITGSNGIPDRGTWESYFFGLSSVGINLRHAKVRNARTKAVEMVIKMLQVRSDGERGYAGRSPDQCPEEVRKNILKVQRGEAHPGEFFLSQHEVKSLYERICYEYNNEPQNGHMLEGLSPSDAFMKFQAGPPIKLDQNHRYLLARSRVETTATANGVKLLNKFEYKSAELSARIHQRVLAWFNPEDPDSICITDLDGRNPITVPRYFPIPAFDATSEQIRAAERQNHAQTKYRRTLVSAIRRDWPAEFANRHRILIPSASAATLGREMEAQRAETIEKEKASERLRLRGNRAAREIGLQPSPNAVPPSRVAAWEKLAAEGIKATNPYGE